MRAELISRKPTEDEIRTSEAFGACKRPYCTFREVQADATPTLGQFLPWLGRMRSRLATGTTMYADEVAVFEPDIERRFTANTERAMVAVGGTKFAGCNLCSPLPRC